MKKVSMVIVSLFATMSMALPAFSAEANSKFREEMKATRTNFKMQQKEENKAFRGTVKGLPADQRVAATQQQHQQQFAENQAFFADQHSKAMTELDVRLAQNPKLTDSERATLRNQAETTYQQEIGLRNARYNETQVKVSAINSDTSMTPEQRKAAIKAVYDQNHASAKETHKTQMTDYKTLQKTLKTN